jgi:hypothetical protein
MDAEIRKLSNAIIGEIFLALGFSKTGTAYRRFGWAFRKAADRLSSISVTADRLIAAEGFASASAWMLTNWCNRVICHGAETIPEKGPVLVISNHAGSYDTFVIASQTGRKDLKLISSDVPFLKSLPNAKSHLIFLSDKTQDRMVAARAGIRTLKEGGALLLFGTGLIDPDPEVYQDAEAWIEKWLPSTDLFLRTVPETQVVLSIVSGVVAKHWARHPITWIKRIDWQKRRLAEFSQVIQQLLFPGSLFLKPNISFSKPITVDELQRDSLGERLLPEVIRRAKILLAEHMDWVKPLTRI